MPLSDRQIERYSRQIIVPGVGGVAQERLLSASLVLCGDQRDIESSHEYLKGAGVREITVLTPQSPHLSIAEPSSCPTQGDHLLFAVISSATTLALAQRLADGHARCPTLIARLDDPARIAILPSPPPCIRCSDADLLTPVTSRSDIADFAAMLATVEAFKLLTGYSRHPASATLIEFTGLATRSRPLAAKARCECSTHTGQINAR
jgi:hypothetical protein